MHAPGLDAIDTTLRKTHTWLKEIVDELGWTDRQRAYVALRGVIHSLRDHLPVGVGSAIGGAGGGMVGSKLLSSLAEQGLARFAAQTSHS